MSGSGYTWSPQSGTTFSYGPRPADTRYNENARVWQRYDQETRSWKAIVCRVAILRNSLSDFEPFREIQTSLRMQPINPAQVLFSRETLQIVANSLSNNHISRLPHLRLQDSMEL